MSEVQALARVILRPDASVHIAMRGVRAVYATPKNLTELFTDPIEFVESGYACHESSARIINRNRVDLDAVLGLTLATVNSDKQIVCDFPELFTFVFSAWSDVRSYTTRLNMSDLKYESVLSDEKAYLLRYYLEFTSSLKPDITIKHNIKLRNEVQLAIIREAVNVFFDETLSAAPTVSTLTDQISNAATTEPSLLPASDEKRLIGVSEFAELYDLAPNTVRIYIRDGRLKNVVKLPTGRYLVDPNETPEFWDRRMGRKRKKPQGEKHPKLLKGASFAEVQERILTKELFTAAVAEYIRTAEELSYYTSHSYHEVCWDGRPALIIDVNPDYISFQTNKSNRELMLEGKPPVVPNRDKEQYCYHIHHVGQKKTSPFAIIPEYDHNGKGLSAVFHQGPNEDGIHGRAFELQKSAFWRNYIAAYDAAVSFVKIPYLNPRKRD